MDALLGVEHVTTIGAYDKKVAKKNKDELEYMWEEAWAYNEQIYAEQQHRSFTYRGSEATDPEYERMLTLSPDDNTMGSVQVPAAGIDLPIAHGTTNKYLDYEAGHMYGTSLPVGGENSHSIIAGHTGLVNADIFTHLDKVEEGDEFYLLVLNRKLVYKVVRVLTILPEEEDPYMQIVPGRDLVTLYTCTPYGVNSHRLLITGERNRAAEETGDDGTSSGVTVVRKDMQAYMKCFLYGAIPFVVAILAWLIVFKKKKKKKKDDIQENLKALEKEDTGQMSEVSENLSEPVQDQKPDDIQPDTENGSLVDETSKTIDTIPENVSDVEEHKSD